MKVLVRVSALQFPYPAGFSLRFKKRDVAQGWEECIRVNRAFLNA